MQHKKFQSLIGKIKTLVDCFLVEKTLKFQSLIGKIKTRNANRQSIDDDKFQSLIGKIKTLFRFKNFRSMS